jgi:energy-coupling factor transport system substrate-specific component
MKKIPIKQLTAISLLVATAAAVRVGMNWAALALTIPIYGVLVKIGLTETLTFVSGFVFGPVQGFITGLLIIIVSDMFTLAGLWTPFVAVIIGMLGLLGGLLRRFKTNPSIVLLGATAVALTTLSELFQNIWFAWYMWAFYMPETPFVAVLGTVLVGGVKSAATAVINNVVLFMAIAPTIIKALQEMVMPKTVVKEKAVQS